MILLPSFYNLRLVHEKNGRAISIESTQKALQFYTGTYLDGVKGRDQAIYNKYSGVCLETQNYTDSVNNQVIKIQQNILTRRLYIISFLVSISKYNSSSR